MNFEELLKILSFVFAVVGIVAIFIISGLSSNNQSLSFFNGSIKSLHCTDKYCIFDTIQSLKFTVFVDRKYLENYRILNTSYDSNIHFICQGNNYMDAIYCEDFSIYNNTQLSSG